MMMPSTTPNRAATPSTSQGRFHHLSDNGRSTSTTPFLGIHQGNVNEEDRSGTRATGALSVLPSAPRPDFTMAFGDRPTSLTSLLTPGGGVGSWTRLQQAAPFPNSTRREAPTSLADILGVIDEALSTCDGGI